MIALVPLMDQAAVGGDTVAGNLHNPPGVAIDGHGAPAQWRPDLKSGLRLASVPTPFALAELTRFVLERTRPKPDDPRPKLPTEAANSVADRLLQGSELLLEGLVAGRLHMEWQEPSSLTGAGRLTQLLGGERLGLIRHADGAVWGYILRDGIPVVAGSRVEEPTVISQLRAVVRPGATPSPAAGELLRAMKQQCAAHWDAQWPWMALVDRVIAALANTDTSGAALSLENDVRSLGPFDLPVGLHGATERRYLLAYAPKFVPFLRSALSLSTVSVQQEWLQCKHGNTVVAEVSLSANGTDWGHGLVRWNTAGLLGPSAPSPMAIHEQWAARIELHPHVQEIRTRVTSLTRAARSAPMMLSDAARAAMVALEGVSVVAGPRLADFLSRTGTTLPDEEHLAPLIADGRAVLVDMQDGTKLLLCEDEPTPEGRHKGGLGELSMLGSALWLCFVLAQHTPTTGYTTLTGDPVFSEYDKVPLYPDFDTLDAWWRRGPEPETGIARRDWQTPARARASIATLQRFVAAYTGPTSEPLDRVAQVAVARFLVRLLNDEDVMSKIGRPGIGNQTRQRGPSMTIAKIGTLRPWIDPVRQSTP